jgi:hypothetical protein
MLKKREAAALAKKKEAQKKYGGEAVGDAI